jgi:hypothetical protein
MKIDICKFSQKNEETIPQACGRFKDLIINCYVHGLKDNELLDTFYNGLTNASRSYIDCIVGNVFRNRTITEARELLDKMVENHDNWTLIEEEETRIVPVGRGILNLPNEMMKEALTAFKEKGIKSINLLKLSERVTKLPIDGPCFPIQVHAISPTKVKEKVIPPVEVSPASYSTKIVCFQHAYVNDIKVQLEENSHKINYLCEVLNAGVDAIKEVTKHCVMMNNQVEQMISLKNKLYK